MGTRAPFPLSQLCILVFPHYTLPAPPKAPLHPQSLSLRLLLLWFVGECPWKSIPTLGTLPPKWPLMNSPVSTPPPDRSPFAPRLAQYTSLVFHMSEGHVLLSWAHTHLLQEASQTCSTLCPFWLLNNVVIPDPVWPSAVTKICPQSSGLMTR